MEISDYNSEGFFTLELIGVKLSILLGIKKFNNLTVVILGVGLHFDVFLSRFAEKSIFAYNIDESLA